MMRIGGLITAKKQVMTKRNEQMAIITVEDFTHAVSVVVFPKTYARYQQAVAVDMAVAIRGRADINDDSIQILAEEVKPLDQERENPCSPLPYRRQQPARLATIGIPVWAPNYSSRSRPTWNGPIWPAASARSWNNIRDRSRFTSTSWAAARPS